METSASASMHFAELFPPLTTRNPTPIENDLEEADGAVDISVDDLMLPPLEQQVETEMYTALQRWNQHEPASGEATMPYMQRLKKYRAIVRWMLYENEDPHPDDEGTVVAASTVKDPSPNARRRLAKQQQKTRRAEIAKYKEIFGALSPIADLRERRRPSQRLERFIEQFPPKKRVLLTKRSVADTQTSMCFEFARRPPPPTIGDGVAGGVDVGDENAAPSEETHEIQRPTVTTAATWRSRTLLASMEEHQQAATMASAQSVRHVQALANREELVLWIDVLHASKDPARTQSFLVLGSHTLSDLLDLVVCAYDQRFEEHGRLSKLLYFDKQFYIDGRDPQNTDYSKEILAWIHAKPSREAKYLRSDETATIPKALESTTFAELALKIDTPGIYIHQGECEHLVRLRDVRILDPTIDSTNRDEDFPMRLPNPLYRQLRSCMVCSNYSAKFVCFGDRMASTDPMFYCDRCFRTAHYDREGKLLFTDFQAFPFIQE